MLELGFRNCKSIFLRMLFLFVTTFFVKVSLYVWVDIFILTHLFPMHPFSTPWKLQVVEKEWIENKWVKQVSWGFNIYHLTFGDKSVRLLACRIWKIYPKLWKPNDLLKQLKVGLSPSKNFVYYLLQWWPFKNDEKCFLFLLKSSSFSRYLHFCLDFLGM